MMWSDRICLHTPVVSALFIATALATCVLAVTSQPALQHSGRTRLAARAVVPAPRDVIGFTPGDDRKLASWAQIVSYFKQLERASAELFIGHGLNLRFNRVDLIDDARVTLDEPVVPAAKNLGQDLADVDGHGAPVNSL